MSLVHLRFYVCTHLIVGSDLTIVDQACGGEDPNVHLQFFFTEPKVTGVQTVKTLAKLYVVFYHPDFFWITGSHFPCNFATFWGKSVL